MSVFVDTTPLRESPPFRRYYFGQTISIVGSMFSVVALQYQAYKLGHDSTTMVAALAFVTLVPFVATSMVGGAVADSHDKRRILLLTQSLLATCSALLAINAFSSHPKLWVLFAVGIGQNALLGIDMPTRQSMAPTLVPRDLVQKAIALNIAAFNIGGIAGPVVAAFFVREHTPWLYTVDAVSFGASWLAVLSLPPRPPVGEKRTVSLSTIAAGFRYLRGERLIQSSLVADLGAMVFGLPDAVFPAFSEHVFHDTRTLGYLKAAPAIGAITAGMLSGWTHRIVRQGRAVIIAICVWGLGVALFGATKTLPVALAGLFVAGGADAVSALFRSTIVQTTVPDEYRGRLSAIFVAVVRGGPKLGETESGIAARVGGLQFAAVSGGLLCLVWIAIVAALYPELRHWESDTARSASEAA